MADNRNRKARPLGDTEYCWSCGTIFAPGQRKMVFERAPGDVANCFCETCGERALRASRPAPERSRIRIAVTTHRERAVRDARRRSGTMPDLERPRWTVFEYALCAAAAFISLYVLWLAVR